MANAGLHLPFATRRRSCADTSGTAGWQVSRQEKIATRPLATLPKSSDLGRAGVGLIFQDRISACLPDVPRRVIMRSTSSRRWRCGTTKPFWPPVISSMMATAALRQAQGRPGEAGVFRRCIRSECDGESDELLSSFQFGTGVSGTYELDQAGIVP